METNITKKGIARNFAVQALYQMEMNNQNLESLLDEYHHDKKFIKSKPDKSFFDKLITNIIKQQKSIDDIIKKALPTKWDIKRLGFIERSILRLACIEFISGEIDNNKIIAQYVDLCDKFVDEKASKFINALLDDISKTKLKDMQIDEIIPDGDKPDSDADTSGDTSSNITDEKEPAKSET